MTIADDLAALRAAIDCRSGQIVHECWSPLTARHRNDAALDGAIERVLDEIERLQDANRWRDARTEHAPAGITAVVRIEWLRQGWPPAVEYAVNESCGDGEWSQSSDHRYMSPYVTHWMPLPDPPQ